MFDVCYLHSVIISASLITLYFLSTNVGVNLGLTLTLAHSLPVRFASLHCSAYKLLAKCIVKLAAPHI